HMGHNNIIRYSNRPFNNVDEMNKTLIKNWNQCVKPNDEIYHLGDFAFVQKDKQKELLKKLNGKKHMILGNHDKVLRNHGSEFISEGLVESIQDYKEIDYNKTKFVLFHYGMRVWNKSHYGSIMLYGHSHGTLPSYGRSVDVGVDCREITEEYRPVSIEEVIEYMKNREIK